MSILTPLLGTTYADATRTEGRAYVLAQFRETADMNWVGRLRAFLTTAELKYKHYKDRQADIRRDRDLQAAIENGAGQATVIVIDTRVVEDEVRLAFAGEGREAGIDFTDGDVLEQCSEEIIAASPLAGIEMEIARLRREEELLYAMQPKYTAQRISSALGHQVTHATIFAARAHAAFDVDSLRDHYASTRDVFRSPLRKLILSDVLSTARKFDNEHPASIELLNEIMDHVAMALEGELKLQGRMSAHPIAEELCSKVVDHLQGADFAAARAREILDVTSDVQSLARQFECVWRNGNRIK